MAPKTIRKAISDALEDLSAVDFEKFCGQLLDRRDSTRVRRNQVENKSFLVITDLLVKTFTETGALKVTLELLREINCCKDAQALEEETSALSSKPGSSDNEHFVDKYRVELIQRLSQVPPVLDHLLFKKIISSEIYDTIMAMPTSQDKMRELYRTSMRGGTVCKDIFYKYLEENHSYLIEDLQKRK